MSKSVELNREVVFKFLSTPREERVPLGDFLAEESISKAVYYKLEGEYALVEKQERNRQIIEDNLATMDKKEYDSEAYLRDRTPEADKALLQSMKNGNSSAIKLFYQLLDRLVEKKEEKIEIGLSADEIARRNLEADRQLRDAGYRVEKVQKESPILPN